MLRWCALGVMMSAGGAAAQPLPPGAPPGTYNAAETTSGAFTADDSLYSGNAVFASRRTGTGAVTVTFRRITVTETSRFWGLTGAGTAIAGVSLGDFQFNFTVDPDDPAVATLDSLNGMLGNEELSVDQSFFRGTASGVGNDYDLLLTPTDGDGVVLEPGIYFISAWANAAPRSSQWTWSELDSGAESDIFYSGGLEPGQFLDILGRPTFGGRSMQTGVMAFDVWMTPVSPPCPADTNNDGLVTPADFNAWILAFNSNAPECDQNGDSLCNPSDFNAWILNFNQGCS